ncbi:putative nuclease HARBI1 isoform X2 [Tanacetum coccineum]
MDTYTDRPWSVKMRKSFRADYVVDLFVKRSARKDVERSLSCVLQGRWGLIQQPARAYEVNTLRRIMYAGIIMHNMILEDQNMSVVDWKHVYSNPARSLQTVWIDRCQTQRVLTPVRGESLKNLNGFDVALPDSHSLWSSQSFGHPELV